MSTSKQFLPNYKIGLVEALIHMVEHLPPKARRCGFRADLSTNAFSIAFITQYMVSVSNPSDTFNEAFKT